MLVGLGASNPAYLTPFVPVRISFGGIHIITTALLDNGSEATLITDSLAAALMLESKSSNIRLRTFHGEDPQQTSRSVQFIIDSIYSSATFSVKRAFIVDSLNFGSRFIDWSVKKNEWSHLKDLPLANYNSDDVNVLIGVNIPGI